MQSHSLSLGRSRIEELRRRRATTTQVSIDTSTPGEHTILYTVTSPTTGLTGSIMRTVIISADKRTSHRHGITPDPYLKGGPCPGN